MTEKQDTTKRRKRNEETMRPYDALATCRKCDGSAIDTQYRRGMMVRTCLRCGHKWNERPLDNPTPAKTRKERND